MFTSNCASVHLFLSSDQMYAELSGLQTMEHYTNTGAPANASADEQCCVRRSNNNKGNRPATSEFS